MVISVVSLICSIASIANMMQMKAAQAVPALEAVQETASVETPLDTASMETALDNASAETPLDTASVAATPDTEAEDTQAGTRDTAAQYVMYVGTNDKDTYKPEHTNEEAMNIVDQICLKYFDARQAHRRMNIHWSATSMPRMKLRSMRLRMRSSKNLIRTQC